jgi:hypothetical protein
MIKPASIFGYFVYFLWYFVYTSVQIKELIEKLDLSLKTKDAERQAYKTLHGIMTQEEREAAMKSQQGTPS